MQGIKISLSFAAFGFVLSLLFGFTSHAAFFILLIRALIIALVFAGIGFGFYFVADKFLMDDTDSMDVSDNVSVSNPQVGSKVDLYVHDEELDADENGNTYFVDDSSRQMLNNSDLRSTGSISRAAAFAPSYAANEEKTSLQESQNEVTSAMAEANAGAAASAAKVQTAEPAQAEERGGEAAERQAPSDNAGSAASSSNEESGGLDTLPDMSSFVMENASSSEESRESAVESDSSYTTTVSTSHNDGSEYGVKDAEVMAKAISSVLSREES
ncbi:hypothetical protein [Treponema sp. C6A8]|uniref:hypothetical protein n=1 Tax=Treponema sp. C6A8 TaxID=1410609 RepID=UPI0004883049|nr:hypothetical protein [Treponema sp. C6A8]